MTFLLLSMHMLRVMSSVRYARCLRLSAVPHMLIYLDNVIGPNGILATKARIVVTNSIHFLRQFDQILYLRTGIILETGTYQDLVNNTDGHLYKLMYVHSRICIDIHGIDVRAIVKVTAL